jgi:membrane protease YdiL (CAAX protease family)
MKTRVIQAGTTPATAPNPASESLARDHDHKPRGWFRGTVDRHPLVAFFVLAFALTWCTVPMGSFMAAGPLIASLVVLGMTEGKPGLRALGRRVVQWRVGWPYYVVALAVPLAVAFVAGKLNVALGASDAAFAHIEVSALLTLFALRMVVPVFAPVGEEPAWRGFALPRLQRARTPFAATLLLGVVVAAWHLPLLTISEEKFEPVMLLGTVFVTFWYTWLFNRTGGSVFITIVAHAADGLIGAKLLTDGGFHGNAADRFEVLYSAGWLLVAVVLVAADRRRWFGPVTDPTLVEGGRVAPTTRRRVGAAVVTTTVVTGAVLLGAIGIAGAKASGHDAYVQRADAICRVTTDEIDAVVEDLGLDPSDADARGAGRKIVDLGRRELRQLRALDVPAADAGRAAAVYRAMEQAWDRVDRKGSVLFDEPGPFVRSTKLASQFGLEVCGRG